MSSSDFGFKKPQPEVYQSMLARIDVRAEDCLFFDDRTTNVEGAKAIGIQAYLFESVEQLRRSIVPT
jgi:putative hydrolase of the HAD superfamily